MPINRKKGDAKSFRVVAERREVIDRDLLSVALFGWIIDKVRVDTKNEAATERVAGGYASPAGYVKDRNEAGA
jgi:hypothetical protein